jgi:hypothetical protein
MTVDPIEPTQLNQLAWPATHAKEQRFPLPFSAALSEAMFAL